MDFPSSSHDIKIESTDNPDGSGAVEDLTSDIPSYEVKPTDEKKAGNRCVLPFKILTKFFIKINDLKGKKKTEFVQKFFEDFVFKQGRQYAFNIIRLILPQLDRERGNYGLKEISLGKLISESLGLPHNEALRLRFYKNPSYHPPGASVGDFVAVMHSVIKNLLRQDSILSVDDVNDYLDQLAQAPDNENQTKTMTKLIQQCTAEDIKWICKIILKDLKIGLKQEQVLPIYHPDALELYNVISNLREVCVELQDKSKLMGTNVYRLFQPIKPMLAGKKTVEEIRSLLIGQKIVIETKFDGERIQCHFDKNDLKFFSRNGIDYTHLYGKKIGELIKQSAKAQGAILDGEIIVLNKTTGQSAPFGMNKTVAMEDSENSEFQLCYMIFDILYVKSAVGEDCNLMNLSLRDRKSVLKRVIKPIKGLLEVVTGKETENVEDVFSEFNAAMLRNEEGIIIKRLDSVYSPNDRGLDWVKLKGEYLEGMIDTLDLLIIGGFFGEGKIRIGVGDWTEHITHFLLGVMRKLDEANPDGCEILPFCKVGTGYSVDELAILRNKLRGNWKKFDPQNKPPYFAFWTPSVSDNPDVYVDSPSSSVILEVKAAEIIKSNTWMPEYTLRFPRVVKIRYDKDWYETLTEDELQKMVSQIAETKGLRHLKKGDGGGGGGGGGEGGEDEQALDAEDVEKTAMRNKKPRVRTAKEDNVYSMFRDTDVSNIAVVDNLFAGCEFYIANIDENFVTKAYLEGQIVKYGGVKVQNYLSTTTHVVASTIDFKLRALIEKYHINVYLPNWIIDSITRKEMMEIAPKYMLYIVPELRKEILARYDKYGDAYYRPIIVDDLSLILKDMKVDEKELIIDDDIIQLRKELKKALLPHEHEFSGKIFFQISYDRTADDKFIKAMITSKGGIVKNKLVGKIDYIIDTQMTKDQKQIIDNYLKSDPFSRIITKQELFNKI